VPTLIRLRTNDKAAGYETLKLVGAPHGKTYTFDQDFPVDINQKENGAFGSVKRLDKFKLLYN
jgi:hypothetical protein